MQKKNTFRIRNTQYRIELSVHKQLSVFNTTYTIQSRVDCPNMFYRNMFYISTNLRMYVYVRGGIRKIIVIFKIRELLHMTFCIVSLFLTDDKVSCVLDGSSMFFNNQKNGSKKLY